MQTVTPLAGVWIETPFRAAARRAYTVTPLAGVWIETNEDAGADRPFLWSLPLRECGLKLIAACPQKARLVSLPLRECGLKQIVINGVYERELRHSPCGSVD